MKKLLKNKKGFTLMEMLIVVAIIVILVAISIPTFSGQLDSAKAATDAANKRAAKAVAQNTDMLDGWGTMDKAEDDDTQVPFNGTLYYNIESGEFQKEEITTAYGQSSANKGKIITITITNGEMTAEPDWVEVEE